MRASPARRRDVVCLLLASVVCSARFAGGEPLAAEASADDAVAALPTTVRVAATHTYLRSGPGDDFYPTERLAVGVPLEVVRISVASRPSVAL